MYGSRVLNKNKYQNTKNFTHLIRIWGNIFLTFISNIINNQKLLTHIHVTKYLNQIYLKILI